MSRPSGERDEFKLTLRNWVINRLNEGNYPGVMDWTDRENDEFYILWTKKGDPNWETHFKVFEDWAKHKGRFKSPPNYDQLKSNFRNLIKKTPDFEALKTVNHQQTGNCKIFRIRSREETVKQQQLQTELKRNAIPEEQATPHNIGLSTYSPDDQMETNQTENTLNVDGELPSDFKGFIACLNIQYENLFVFQLIVKYKGIEVQNLQIDLRNKIQLYCGNKGELGAIASTMYGEDLVSGVTSIELPPSEERYVAQILDDFGFGIILAADTNATVYLSRFCAPHIYHPDFEGENLSKVERTKGKDVNWKAVFNYVDVMEAMYKNKENKRKTIPACETFLLIGSRKSLISVTLQPVVADVLSEAFMPGSQLLSYSNKDSIDSIFELLKGSVDCQQPNLFPQ